MTPKYISNLRRRGQALIEFTFVGIPLIFVLISTFELSRGMWIYHTLAHSVRDGVRYASVHGENCALLGNTCSVTMRQIAAVIRDAGVGLDPASTNVKFYTFQPGAAKAQQGATCTLDANSCAATVFPPAGLNKMGIDRIEIDITTPFNSAIAMFWPGAGPVSFANGTLGAASADVIQF